MVRQTTNDMKVSSKVNGKTIVYIAAESVLDKTILQELAKGPVVIQWLDNVILGDDKLVDVISITPAPVQKPTVDKQPEQI